MQIITLNTWGGRAGTNNLIAFFKTHAATTDVFCLQEIWRAPYEHLEGLDAGGLAIKHTNVMTHGLQEISDALPNFQPYFRPHHLNDYGLLILAKKNLTVTNEGELFVHKTKDFLPVGDIGLHARNIQYLTLKTTAGPRTIINFHGLWNGLGKEDSADRLTQSQNIINFIKTLPGEVILCGDFNLNPETESINMFESQLGLKNLIKEFGITSTRTSFYTKPGKFADYIFTSPSVVIKNFQVLPEEVSDHAPLLLEI